MPDTVQFRFILQNILREKKKVGLSFRYLEDENFIRCILECVLKGFPHFKFNVDIYRALIYNMNIDDYWESQWRLAQDTPQSEQLTQLMSTAFDWIHYGFNIDDFTWQTDPTHTSFEQVKYELQQVRAERRQVRAELQQVRAELQQVRAELQQVRAELQQVRAELQPGPRVREEGGRQTHTKSQVEDLKARRPQTPCHYQLVVQILRSLNSQNTSAGGRASTAFIRARQRVALCILLISGFNIPKLRSLKVADLKHLLRFGTPLMTARPIFEESDTQHLLAGLREEIKILIGGLPEEAPAFRRFKSEKAVSRAGLTNELNKILSPWKLSTKLLRPD